MKPAPFEYAAPNTLGEAITLLSENDPDEVKILAGGQSLMPMINMRLARPGLVLDLTRVTELDYIREIDGGLAIGAMATKRAVEDSQIVRERHGLFREATILIGHPQIRNRGTVGGSMAQADPAAEYPAVALALDMQMVIRGPAGERTVAAEDFFITYLTTALEPNEILTEVQVPELKAGTGWSFQEVARRHGDFAMVGGAFTLRVTGGSCSDARIVLFGIGDKATRFPGAEAVVNGAPAEPTTFERAGQRVSEEIDEPMSDVHASAEYRRDLARVLTSRGLAEAATRTA
jgi:CO/xanthine dehydrogenase FAD-binding subunit